MARAAMSFPEEPGGAGGLGPAAGYEVSRGTGTGARWPKARAR